MLRLSNVSKYYYQDGVIAAGFTKVNLELHLGEFVVITGESGSGKSTLLNVLSGLDSYEDGEMYINGEETSHYTEEDYLDYRRKYVSNIFQNFNLVNSYTVYENIELALLMNGKRKSEIKNQVKDLIKKVGLEKYSNIVTSKLSGGQKQRVAIARALANDTPIIVADEPTGSLDSKSSSEILKLLSDISEEKLVIVVTHNKKEIEKYATRQIRMHDGKLLEDKIIKKINLDNLLEPKKVKSITPLNKMLLGIRNTFNIPVKFTLMFIIFLLITVALITNYGVFQATEYESNNFGYTDYFMEDSDYRIILKKNNGTYFTENDYNRILSLNNIESLEKNDLLLDFDLGFYSDNLYLYGTINTNNIDKVDVGRLPKEDNEVVIKGRKDNWYISSSGEEMFEEKFKLETYSDKTYPNDIKVVGIIYDEEKDNYNDSLEFFLSPNLLEEINLTLNERYSNKTFMIDSKYINNYGSLNIIASDKVQKGNAYISDEFNMYCNNYDCLNKEFKINSKNIYGSEVINLKIAKTYNQDNIKNLLDEEYIYGSVFINKDDYNTLFNKNNYQSSVFVKELKDLDNTVLELEKLGFNTLKMKDAKYNEGDGVLQIIKIFKLIVTTALIITLFFISYFIIKIIYKSRNSYYTTLRTLGGTKKICVNILMKELFTLATLTYSLFLIFILLVNKEIISFNYFKEITKYIGIVEYIIIYSILIILSVLISKRYGRKIFKNSIIKTYGERI